MQWGRVNNQTSATCTVTFPFAFINTPRISYNIETIGPSTNPINCDYIIELLNNSGFILHQAVMSSFSWIAIGY